MKAHFDELTPMVKMLLKGCADSFFHKRTNGRWR
jgi:hypothetical protein